MFAAYADPAVRAIWTAPSPEEAVIYADTDFRPGGTDHFRCGPAASPTFAGTTRYEVVEYAALIVCQERISEHGRPRSLSTITWRFTATGAGTVLSVTDQVTALDSPAMIDGARTGYHAALANLAGWLARPGPTSEGS